MGIVLVGMPLYEQIIVAMPKTTAQSLVELFKKYTKTIISNGGVVRGIENHGIRPLPEKAKRKYATISGERIVWDARYVSTHIDASPATLVEVDRYGAKLLFSPLFPHSFASFSSLFFSRDV